MATTQEVEYDEKGNPVSGDTEYDEKGNPVSPDVDQLTQQTTQAAKAAGAPTTPAPTPLKGQMHPESIGTALGHAAGDYAPTVGMVAGGLLGTGAEPGLGTVAGSALGGAAGEQAKRLLQGQPTTTKQAGVETGKSAIQGAESEMGGQILGKAIGTALPLIKTPSQKAANLYERGVAPSGLSAEDQGAMRESWNRASKYLGDFSGQGKIEGGEGGAMRSAETVNAAKEKLWDTAVKPNIQYYKNVTGDGTTLSDAIMSKFTDLDEQTGNGVRAIRAGERLAAYFRRPISVGELSDVVTQLNNDRAVSKFYSMSPNEQASASLADPTLRSKVALLDAARNQMVDLMGSKGGEEFGQQFREVRKDWGALNDVESMMRESKVPTPQPLHRRLMNSIRGSFSPHGSDFWLRSPQTLFNEESPNRLLPKSLNTIRSTGMSAPEPPIGKLLTRPDTIPDAEFYDLPGLVRRAETEGPGQARLPEEGTGIRGEGSAFYYEPPSPQHGTAPFRRGPIVTPAPEDVIRPKGTEIVRTSTSGPRTRPIIVPPAYAEPGQYESPRNEMLESQPSSTTKEGKTARWLNKKLPASAKKWTKKP